ncbi:unnamed protein product [Cuscuta epithymum]|uniref:Uncharacterized protein n=1 Tax=Cuscuta epithymum TaxID=186058 RepID=A0AAV0EIR3_9ASTE|nr:unnamed protein product [Cuscuta epithymum]
MEDILTEIPPPSRFFLEDLNNFAPRSPPLPSPFLMFATPNPEKYSHPSLLIIAMSFPSTHFFHHVSSKTLVGTLILPETLLSGNSIVPSLKDKSCNIYALHHADKLVLVASVQCPINAERSHAVAKLLVGQKIKPDRVLVLDTIQSRNFRGKLPPDETLMFKLESSLERKDSELVKGLDYFPSGSVVDGLAAALLGRCEIDKIRGTVWVSWPETGGPVTLAVKSHLLKNYLPGMDHTSADKEKSDFSGTGRTRDYLLDSDMYT